MASREAEDPDPARHRPAAQRLRRRGGGRCGRRAPVPPRRRDAGRRSRPGLRGPVHARARPTCRATAIFIGGSNVAAGEAVLDAVKKTFFGPFRVSVLFDANGANTTAAAAVLAASRASGGSLEGVPAAVLAATGPVGQRAARLLCRLGAKVAVGSRRLDRASALAESLGRGHRLHGHAVRAAERRRPGRQPQRRQGRHRRRGRGRHAPARLGLAGPARPQALIDLNAVPPWASRASRRPTRRPAATSAPGVRWASAAPR